MKSYDVIIIGGGPGGYVAAIRAAQLGLKTAVVEKHRLGGMCLNWGCVPSRRFMECARVYDRVLNSAAFGVQGVDPKAIHFDWKKAASEKDRIVTKLVKGVEFLMKKNKVDVIAGEGKLLGGTRVAVGDETYETRNTIIATGSRPDRASLARAPQSLLVEIDELYKRDHLPERTVVAGGDTVACEMASMLRLIGKTVTVVTAQSKLMGWLDDSLTQFIADKFKKQGIRVLTESAISGGDAGGIKVGDEIIACDLVINCERRAAVLPEMEDVPLDLENDFIAVNEFMQTSVPSVYAIGDVTGKIFAHVASAQGVCAVNHIAGLKEPVDDLHMPVTIYMDPEIGSVGRTEEQLQREGIAYVRGDFPLNVNSKAIVEGNTEGFVKVLADQKYGEILGVHVIASRATDLISEAAMCMKTEGTLDDLTRVVHAHPTVSETVLEAGFKASGKPLHI